MGIKQAIGKLILRQELEARKKKRRNPVSFSKATLFGILYNTGDEKQKQMVKEIIEALKEEKKEAVSLGYVDAREFPATMHDRYGYEYFNRKYLNWMGFATHANVGAFIRQEFDFLINLDSEHPLHFLELMTKSKAGYRVGPYSEKLSAYYDLMIDTKSKNFTAELISLLKKMG